MVPLRTLLLGSHALCAGLRAELQDPASITLVGEATSLAEGVGLAISLRPDLVVLGYGGDFDSTIRGVDGLQAANPMTCVLLVGAEFGSDELALAMQAGIREVLSHVDELPRAIERSHVFLSRLRGARSAPQPPRSKTGRLIVVHSPKGGAGKSTLAVNLALSLASDEVVLVDLAPQFGEADLLLNLKPHAYLSDVAKLGPQPDAEAIEQALVVHSSGVKLLASAPTPEDGELIDRPATSVVLRRLQQRFGVTVVDTAPVLSEPIVHAMELADRILVPFFPDLASLRHVQQSLKLWQDLGIDLEKVELVGWAQKSDVDPEAIARILKRPLSVQLPYVPEEALAAVNAGAPMLALAPHGVFAKALRAYSKRFSEASSNAPIEVKAASGRWGEWWHRLRRMIDVSAQPT